MLPHQCKQDHFATLLVGTKIPKQDTSPYPIKRFFVRLPLPILRHDKCRALKLVVPPKDIEENGDANPVLPASTLGHSEGATMYVKDIICLQRKTHGLKCKLLMPPQIFPQVFV